MSRKEHDVGIAAGLRRPDHRGVHHGSPRGYLRGLTRLRAHDRARRRRRPRRHRHARSTPSWTRKARQCQCRRTSPETSCASSTPTFTSTTAAATACFPVCRSTSSGSSCKGLMTHTNGSTSRVRPTSSMTARRRCSPGIRLLPTPGHTRGHQSVLVDTPDGLVVIGGDVAYTFHERERRDRGTAARTRASRSDVAHARGRGTKVPRPN